MKENKLRLRQAVLLLLADYRSKLYCTLLTLCLVSFISHAHAQCTLPGTMFNHKEQIKFDVYFKWGLLMPKAGTAILLGKDSFYQNNPAWHYRLLYGTSGMIDKMFSVKDTIDCYYTSSDKPYLLYSSKRTCEGGYYQIDNLTFSYKNNVGTAHSFRRSLTAVKVDTTFIGNGCLFDVLGALMYMRSLDWNQMKQGDQVPLQVAMGRDFIHVTYRYMGQQILERGDVKYRTRFFYIDINDDAFTQKTEAAEIWIGDDENHIPIKIRAKLKIGAAEAYYHSSSNLRYPLNCRIVIPKK